MPADGERIATNEQSIRDIRGDIEALGKQMDRTRTRLHNLEGFAQAYLDTQRANRRQERRENERLANSIQLGGLLVALAMLALTAVTIFYHG